MGRSIDQSFGMSRSWYAIREFKQISGSAGKGSASRFREGVVASRAGLIWVYSEEGLSNYHVILAGRHYTRSEDRSRDNTGLARTARKFVKDLLAKK